MAALQAAIQADDGERLRQAADALLVAAAAGQAWAVQMLADRLDGKPAPQAAADTRAPQVVIVTGVPGTQTAILHGTTVEGEVMCPSIEDLL